MARGAETGTRGVLASVQCPLDGRALPLSGETLWEVPAESGAAAALQDTATATTEDQSSWPSCPAINSI